ncbi:MAG: RNA-binding cell elongation regulator Jag/EloR [Anaerolineales bacterium]
MESRATLEVIAPSVEEAVAKGINELGVPEEAVDVEILDSGSRGLLGIGSRQARIRLIVKAYPSTGAPGKASPETESAEMAGPEVEEEFYETPEETAQPASQETATTSSEDITLYVARETVVELLEKMKVRASVTSYYGETEDARDRVPICVDINGKDLSILIGRQAETLNALQYIASLIIGKELGHSIPLVLDVEGYRRRRTQQLRYLARRMADQAVKTGRRQVLEPMPPNERRIIHIELRENPEVTTESVGEEPRRKVTIIPQ